MTTCLHLRPFHITLLLVGLLGSGCAHVENRTMTVTAYCGCGECNGYYRGSWMFLKLNFWNRYLADGPNAGEPYDGRTASGERLRDYHPGLISTDSLTHPWMMPFRIALPWLWFPQDGTLAADTDFYPFGTRMFVPEYGWGQVQDRGRKIKGPDRLDVFMRWHRQTERWGRRETRVRIMRE
jgi:hypothetical protein